jgi:hypothetical protein
MRDDFHRAYFKKTKDALRPIVWGRFNTTREAMTLFSVFSCKVVAKFIYLIAYSNMSSGDEAKPISIQGFSLEGHKVYF